jgi:VCBS repeat-containing protein
MAEANTSSTQQAADAQHVDNMTSMQQSTPDAPSGARSDAPVQTNNVGTQDGPSQLNSNPTGNSTGNNNLGGGQQNSPINGSSFGNLGGGAGPGGGDAIGGGGALNVLAGNGGGAGNTGGGAGQGSIENAGGAGDRGAGGGNSAPGTGARVAAGFGGGGAGDVGGGEGATTGATTGSGEGGGGEGGGTPPPTTASAPISPTSTTIPLTTLTAEEELAIAAIEANNESISSGQPVYTVIEAGGVNNAIPGIPSVSNTLISADGSAFIAVTTAAASELGFGTYTINANGEWNYTLTSNSNTTIQALNVGDTLDDTFTVITLDGAEEIVTVRIVGANDHAVIRGVTSVVLEKTMSTVDGTLTSVDVDNIGFREQTLIAGLNEHGTFILNADGTWSYRMNSSTPFTVSSNTDSFEAVSADGTAKQIVTVSQFIGSQSPLTQYVVGEFIIVKECIDCEDYLSFIPQSNIYGGAGGVVSITPTGNWQFTQLTLPTISDTEYINTFSLPFEFKVDGTIYNKNIDLTVSVQRISDEYIYSTSFTNPDPDPDPDGKDLFLENYGLVMSITDQNKFDSTDPDKFDSTDHINLISQVVISGLTGVVSSGEENIGTLIVNSAGNYIYVINQVPVNAVGQYTSAPPLRYETLVLDQFTNLFYQGSNHTDTFNVTTIDGIDTVEVNIGNTIIGMVINDNVLPIPTGSSQTITEPLGLAPGSQNVSIISGGYDASNFYINNIGRLSLNDDGTFTYEITADDISAWKLDPDYESFGYDSDLFLVSSTVGNSINIQALEFKIFQESNTTIINNSSSTHIGRDIQPDIYLYDTTWDSIGPSPASYSHTINQFEIDYDRIDISKLLTNPEDLLSGKIYIDPLNDRNSYSEIHVNHSGSDYIIAKISAIQASIPELMWNEDWRETSNFAPVTSLNAVTSWTETLEIAGVTSYNEAQKTFSVEGAKGEGWTMQIVSSEEISISGSGANRTMSFGDKAAEVVFSYIVGEEAFTFHDISHVDKINWQAAA